MPPGRLFVVATPIGNLEDLTFRALRTLREVHLIAAEDTRRTSKLLARYEIRKPLVSLHEHNEFRQRDRLVGRMNAGEDLALVSDAGTPGISDPGAPLVRAARDAGLHVVPIPGPSAIAAALSISGIDLTEFAFMGFPPRAGTSRVDWMHRLKDEPRTVVFFEAPHRLERTLDELAVLLVDRPIQINKEISKIHETFALYPISADSSDPSGPVAGEYTVVVGPGKLDESPVDSIKCCAIFGRLTETCGFTDDEALRMTAAAEGVPQSAVRKAIKKARILAKRDTPPIA